MSLLVLYGVTLVLGAINGEEAGLASGQDPETVEEQSGADDPAAFAVNGQEEPNLTLELLSCEDDSAGIPLCRECRYIRKLSADFSPQYLLERRCQGQTCLSYEGICTQQYMAVQVRNIAPDAESEDLFVKVGTGCRCLLREDSLFRPFVR